MTTYYVGAGGNNTNAGTSWAQRKLTLNGAEDIPVQAGDTVYIGAGTYRETLTCDVSGSSGSPISYIGDYTGANTDGTGGVVRISASSDDLAGSTNAYITATAKNYRTFSNFVLSESGSTAAVLIDGCTNWVLEKLYFTNTINSAANLIKTDNATTSLAIRNCYFVNNLGYGIYFYDNADLNDTGNVVENCLFLGATNIYIRVDNVGGITVRNCSFIGWTSGGAIRIAAALASGQTVTVNNCLFAYGAGAAVWATAAGELVEDYNNFYTVTARTNVNTGANSTANIIAFDTRWFFEMVNGGTMLTPFDLASYSGLLNIAGTSPTTADMRGTTVQGTQREWGALEYDSTLDIEAGSGGGAVSIQPIQGSVRL